MAKSNATFIDFINSSLPPTIAANGIHRSDQCLKQNIQIDSLHVQQGH